MSYTTAADGTRLYYEVNGQGEPLLLIMGLGMNATGWHHNVPDLAAHFQVIAFDNRGTGRSDKPDIPYSIPLMAQDAATVLDALSVPAAHVLGASMGGYIAQEFALHYPTRVRRLVLACTSPGGTHAVPPGDDAVQMVRQREKMTPEQAARLAVPFIYAPGTIQNNPELIESDIAQRLIYATPAFAYGRQLQACFAHNTWDRLPQIKAPTLVIHGGADRLVPTANAPLLAERIPGAKLVVVPDVGHMFFGEAADTVNQTVVDFLKDHSR